MQQNVVAFQIPTQILFGVGALERVVEQVRIEDRPKVLIATDQGVKKAGLLDMLTAVLETGGVPFALFDETEPNPNVEMVEKATNLFRREACNSVVGLGGGSSMDVAKAAAVMATNPGSIRDYEGIGKIGQKPAPIIAIPTTAGTWAEVTPFIVITDVVRRYKMIIGGPQAMPSVAIVDPSLMVTMPAQIAASTGLDALTHGIECYTSLLPNSSPRHWPCTAFTSSARTGATWKPWPTWPLPAQWWPLPLASRVWGIIMLWPIPWDGSTTSPSVWPTPSCCPRSWNTMPWLVR
jgi:alcohol dehydrogenase